MKRAARSLSISPGPASLLNTLPRVTERAGIAASLLGGALLLAVAATGAAITHLLEYHLALGGGAAARTAAATMMAHCPLNGSLALVLVFAVLTLGLCVREVRLLRARRHALVAMSCRAGLPAVPYPTHVPRRPSRWLGLFLLLFPLQIGIYLLFAHICPMDSWMRMDGVWMHMAPDGTLPLLPMQLLGAAVLTTLLWRCEHRMRLLRVGIAAIARLLHHWLAKNQAPIPSGMAVPLRPLFSRGLSGLSRPPPILA